MLTASYPQDLAARVNFEKIIDKIYDNGLNDIKSIKAIKDFNCSKFSRENLLSIEGIISDVFKTKENMMG